MTARTRVASLVLGLILTFIAAPAQAGSPGSDASDLAAAQRHVESLGNYALAALQTEGQSRTSKEAALGAVLREGVAVDLIGRFVLGRHWRRATDAERSAYRALFQDFVVISYASYLEHLAGSTFEISQSQVVGDQDVLVVTLIERPGLEPVKVGWRVRKIDGRYKIIDVVIAGVSLAATQRQEFAAVISRHGIGGLLDLLREKTRTLTASR